MRDMYLGGSDIAQLLLTSCESEQGIAFALRMGADGGYTAHIIEGGEKVKPHYKLVYTCRKWLWVYDDTGRTAEFRANIIKVYRAGDYVYGDTELEAMEDVANFVAESYLKRLDEGDVMRDDRYPIIPYIKIVACDNGEVSFAQVIFKENGSRPKGIIHLWVEEVEEEEE